MKDLGSILNDCDAAWKEHLQSPKVINALGVLALDSVHFQVLQANWKLSWLRKKAIDT